MTAAGVLLLAAVVGLTVGNVLLNRKNREVEASQKMTQGQVDYLITEVSEDILLNEPGMEDLRQRILDRVLNDYAEFLKKRPGNPFVRQQMAGAKRQLGELYSQTGRLVEARELEVQAVEQYEGLLREEPANPKLRFGLANARHVLAELQVQSGDLGEGKKEVDRGIELLETLKTEEPGNGEHLIALARAYDLRATADAQQGDIEAGLADNRRVLDILAENISPERYDTFFARYNGPILYHPTMGSFRPNIGTSNPVQNVDRGQLYTFANWRPPLALGKAWTNQGILLSLSGRNGEAAQMLEQAIVGLRVLVEAIPRSGQFRQALALALLHSGRIRVRLGLPESGAFALREALGLMQQVIRDDPFVPEYRSTRLLAAGYLGEALFRQGRTAAATELLREVEKQGKEILIGSARNHELLGHHARLLHVLGSLERDCGNVDRGRAVCRQAQGELERALGRTPGNRSVRTDGLTNREALARCRFQAREIDRGRLDRREARNSRGASGNRRASPFAPVPGGNWPSRPPSWRADCWRRAGRPRPWPASMRCCLPQRRPCAPSRSG